MFYILKSWHWRTTSLNNCVLLIFKCFSQTSWRNAVWEKKCHRFTLSLNFWCPWHWLGRVGLCILKLSLWVSPHIKLEKHRSPLQACVRSSQLNVRSTSEAHLSTKCLPNSYAVTSKQRAALWHCVISTYCSFSDLLLSGMSAVLKYF